MLLCMHQGTDTKQWGITVTVLKKRFVFIWHSHITLRSKIQMLYQTKGRHRCYSLLLRYMQTDHLSNPKQATQRTSRKKVAKPTGIWGNLKVLIPVRPTHAMAWNTTVKTPSHNTIGSIFSFFLNKIKIMLCLTTNSIWHLIAHGNKNGLLYNLQVL